MDIGLSKKLLYILILLSCVAFIIYNVSSFKRTGDEVFISSLSLSPPPLTIQLNGGRLGNQMFTYAALFGLSTLNKRSMQILQRNYDVLSEYFDIVTPVIDEGEFVKSNPWFIGNWLRDQDYHIPVTSNYITGNTYPTSYTFFHHIHQEIREVFRFKPSYRKYAQDILWSIKKMKPNTQVYVGVHVRRGDYLKHSDGGWLRAYDGREVDIEFFEKAMKHFTSKYKNVTFLALSDDRKWCRDNLTPLGIVTTPDSPSAGHDLALLSHCNHTIMSYGTYGFWGGYLGGGEVVYFSDFLKPNTSFVRDYFVYEKMYPPEWIGISTTKPGFWESYTNPYLTK